MPRFKRPPWPEHLFNEFNRVADKLGYTKRGARWKLLSRLVGYAEEHPKTFKSDL